MLADEGHLDRRRRGGAARHRRRPSLRGDQLPELLQQGAQTPDHLDARGAVLADLRDRRAKDLRPGTDRHDHAALERDASRHGGCGRCADHPQGLAQVVEDLYGGGRVVHGRRERPCRDVHHHPDGEGGVLLDRPLDAKGDEAQPDCRVAAVGRSAPWTSSTLAPTGTKSPSAWRKTSRHRWWWANRVRPRASTAWIVPARCARSTKVGAVVGPFRALGDEGRVRPRRLRERVLEGTPALGRHQAPPRRRGASGG